MIKTSATKKGAASLYVVVFATILFGVIALSFIRIVVSELSQSSNDELSQSAYDSALAGVEDAKIAVNKYYQCMSNGTGTDCARYLDTSHGSAIFDGQCADFRLKALLYPDSTDTEVKIQESVSNNSDQAYTCVIIKNKVPDYRSTLTSDNRTRVIPIGIGSASLADVRQITLRWYSEINGTEFRNISTTPTSTFGDKNSATTPPTISLTLLKTGPTFTLNDFNNSTSADYSTMIFLPYIGDGENIITRQELINNANSDIANSPRSVQCAHGEFACSVTLDLGDATPYFEAGGNAMLIVSMPYGDLVTDFAITLKDVKGDDIEFENVQISVDSTGRANQLYRRVETRLDPADMFFPYPQYEVELSGNSEDALRKYFWITYNCWTEKGLCDNNGELGD